MRLEFILILIFSFNLFAFDNQTNACLDREENPFTMIEDAFSDMQRVHCNTALRSNILDKIGKISKDDYCSDFSLRRLESRECNQFYQFVEPEADANNIIFQCMASYYNGQVSGNNPDGQVRGRFSIDEKKRSYRHKVAQLQTSFEGMLEDQINLTTGINQHASNLLLENLRLEGDARKFKCIPDSLNTILKCENQQAQNLLAEIIAKLRKQNNGEPASESLKDRYEMAIEAIVPDRDVNPTLFSLSELQNELHAAQNGYSFGDRYYLSDETIFPHNETGGNLAFMHFYRSYDDVEVMRADIKRHMNRNFREQNQTEDLTENFIAGRDQYIDQLESRFTKANALLKTTQFMLEHYRDVQSSFAPGTKYDHVLNHVDNTVKSQLGDISDADLISTGWFKEEDGKLKINRSVAYKVIDKAIAASEDLDDLNTLYVPKDLDEFGTILTEDGNNEFDNLVKRCDSFIEATENLCIAMESNAILMNDSAAKSCLREIEQDDIRNENESNKNLVILSYQYCSGEDGFLYGGEPIPEPDNEQWIEYISKNRDQSAFSGLTDEEIQTERGRIKTILNDDNGTHAPIDLEVARNDLALINQEIEKRDRNRLSNLPDSDLNDELETHISLLRNRANLSADIIDNSERLKRLIEEELALRRDRDHLEEYENQCENNYHTALGKRACDMAERLRKRIRDRQNDHKNSTYVPDRSDDYDNYFYSGNFIGPRQNLTGDSDANETVKTVVDENERLRAMTDDSEKSQIAKASLDSQVTDQQPLVGEFVTNPDFQFENTDKIDGENSFRGISSSTTTGLADNNIKRISNSINPMASGFESIEGRIRGIENNITERLNAGESSEALEIKRMREQLNALKKEREDFLVESAKALDQREKNVPEPVATPQRVQKNITSTFRPPLSEQDIVEEPVEQLQTGIIATDNSFSASKSGDGFAAPGSDNTDDNTNIISSVGPSTYRAADPFVLTSQFGNIVLDTSNIATFTQIPEQLLFDSPELLNIDEMQIGDIRFLKLDDGTIIMHEKRSDGTLFRQQVVLGDSPTDIVTRKPASDDVEESEARIRYEYFREVGN